MSDNRMLAYCGVAFCAMWAIIGAASAFSDAEKERCKTELRKSMIEKDMTLEQIKEFEKVK